MKEVEPIKNSTNPDEFKNPFKEDGHFEELAEFLRRHRLTRRLVNMVITSLFYTYIPFSSEGRRILKDPDARRILFNREGKVGLLEDAIFNADLYFPNKEDTSLEYRSAAPGRWVGYDFHRKQEFGKKARSGGEGRLFAFMLDEVKNSGSDDYTPTGLVQIFDLDHMLHLETPSIDDLLSKGFTRETTYKAAFQKAGLYGKYQKYLGLAALTAKPLYTVTPKGNGLIFLSKDGGDKTKKRKEVGVLKPVLGF